MFILADIAIIIHNKERGFGRYSEPHKEPPEKVSPHRTIAHNISEVAIIFCTNSSTFSDLEKVAIKVNKIADIPHKASARCSRNTTLTPAMAGAVSGCS